MKIFVTGASGFLGRNLIPVLLEKGHEVVAWKHREESLIGGPNNRLTSFWGDLSDSQDSLLQKLQSALTGSQVVVHLAAKTSEGPSHSSRSRSVNVEGTAQLLKISQEARVKRFIFVSTQSAKISRPGRYGATKKQAEELVQKTGMDFAVLRPAIVYGPGPAGIFTKFVKIIEKFPMIPIPSTGVAFQPVFVGDVASAILGAIETKQLKTRVFDVAGPDPVTFPEFIRMVASAKNLSRSVVPVPISLALLGARILSKIMEKPPVTVDNLIGLSESTSIYLNPLKEELHTIPLPLKEGLKKTFEGN